jgi:hypothetical protein
VTITWAFDDGTTAAGERVAKAWTGPGRHTATVTATDATGLSVSRTLRVQVVDAAALPPQPGAVQIPRPGPAAPAAARVTLAAGPLRLAPHASVAARSARSSSPWRRTASRRSARRGCCAPPDAATSGGARRRRGSTGW